MVVLYWHAVGNILSDILVDYIKQIYKLQNSLF